jgi:nucleotide-binding universal stress UspA family protein
MTTAMPPARFQHLVVGYDGSPPASRALDAAAQQLQGRPGRIDVVYVAHLSSLVALSPAPSPKWKKTSTRSRRIFAPKPTSSCAAAERPGSSNGARAPSPIS